MQKCNILFPVGCRSDMGLSMPIINRLQKNEMFDCYSPVLTYPGKFFPTILECQKLMKYYHYKYKEFPDLVFIVGDRIEMTAIASWTFHNKVPIAHYYGGVINDPITTLDDINRHCISLWSDIQFVESKIALMNLEVLFHTIKKPSNCRMVGITHMENIKLDTSKVPAEDYDLILINPTTLTSELVEKWKTERREIVIGPNPDGELTFKPTYDNLPREQFLGLLKHCNRFITNSSSAIYEAPFLIKPEQIIKIGGRNVNRKGDFYRHKKYLASELIEQKLIQWWIKKNE